MKKEKKISVKRISKIERGKADITVTELFAIAKNLNVHPFALLWPGKIKDADLETVSDFFKSLSLAKIKKAACVA